MLAVPVKLKKIESKLYDFIRNTIKFLHSKGPKSKLATAICIQLENYNFQVSQEFKAPLALKMPQRAFLNAIIF